MPKRLMVGVAAMATAAVVCATPLLPAGAETAASTDTGRTHAASSRVDATVTLVTGDKVHYSTDSTGKPLVSVDLAPGTTGFKTQTVDDHVYVIPDGVEPYLATGAVDRELFDVTTLVESKYDDAHTSSTPVIVQQGRGTRSASSDLPGATKTLALPSIGGAALGIKKKDTGDLWKQVTTPSATTRSTTSAGHLTGIAKIWLDGRAKATGDPDTDRVLVGAPQAWAAGHDGHGATVAVLDTGVDMTHPDLTPGVTGTESFVPDEVADRDPEGHGTHTASTIVGSGEKSDGLYPGVAPGASLLEGKVLGDDGYGQDSWIIAGMEWAASHADVVSMSLGDPSRTDGTDPMSQAVATLTEQTGALFVIAAGNSGSEHTVSSPGTSDAALTVAATDNYDNRAYFSSQGPRSGDEGLKPDIAAPGVGIVAARSQQSPGEGWYVSMDGTSMATPHVAGAAAIVKAAHPDWTATHVKDALMSSSHPLDGTTPYQVGAGRLDIMKALDGLDATGSVNLGFYRWPHATSDPVTRTITYTNDTDTAVDLALTKTLTGGDASSGGVTPRGFCFPGPCPDPVTYEDKLALSADQVSVPAHGTATVDVTVDSDDLGTGRFTGAITATATDGTAVHTEVALVNEDERYDVDISALDRSGNPTGGTVTVYQYGKGTTSLELDPTTGTVPTQRLAPGTYVISSWLDVPGEKPGEEGVAFVGDPEFVVTGDGSVTLDARKAVPVTLTTPKASETSYQRIGYADTVNGALWQETYTSTNALDRFYAAPVEAGDKFEFTTRFRNISPLTSLNVTATDEAPFHPVYQNGSGHLVDGKVDLPLVTAGPTPAEIAATDVAGKAVIVPDDPTVDPTERATAANEGGAKLLIVVSDEERPLFDYAGGTATPVMSIPASEGPALLAAGRKGNAKVHGTATEFPTYLYDISKSYAGQIPDSLALAPTSADLATVEQRFATATGTPLAFETRYDCHALTYPPCLGVDTIQGLGRTRTDYVSTYEGSDWYQDVSQWDGWGQRAPRRGYTAGSTQTQKWFAPVTAPANPDPGGYQPAYHNGNFFVVLVPPASGPGGEGDFGLDYTDATRSSLWSGDTKLREVRSFQVAASVPETEGTHQYKLVADHSSGTQSRWSTTTHSEWTFSASIDMDDYNDVYSPLLYLTYDVPTDLDGYAAGTSVPITIKATEDSRAELAGTPSEVTLQFSTDGTTWKPVTLTRSGSTWAGSIPVAKKWSGAISLKATGADDAGNTVSQQITDAFGVR